MLFDTTLTLPDHVEMETDSGRQTLSKGSAGAWGAPGVDVEFVLTGPQTMAIRLRAPALKLCWLRMSWTATRPQDGLRVLGDHWERSYGDLEWRGLSADRVLPWYFLVYDGGRTAGMGVMTQPAAICHWIATPVGVQLDCDLRSGPRGVELGDRTLTVATVVKRVGEATQTPFAVASALCAQLCPNPRRPAQPVYGINDWYYCYTNNSRELTLRDTETLAELTAGLSNRPYSVIDDGWQQNPRGARGGPWFQANDKYGDMRSVAQGVKDRGARPGIWLRLLRAYDFQPCMDATHDITSGSMLDPTDPAVREYLRKTIQVITREWGFELIKHDFSSLDLFASWGWQMMDQMNSPQTPRYRDASRTMAEIVTDFYRDIREAAGDSVCILGCNTVGHLGAGLIDVQRTSDDTSGHTWPPNRKMGVNTLALRMPQNHTFFEIDPDCVGLTTKVPWHLNRQWLDLVARSGAPLFASIQPEALNAETRPALKDAFARASMPQPNGEPLDWLDTPTPRKWRFGSEEITYDWYT